MSNVLALHLPDVYQFATLTVLVHHWNQATGLAWPSVDTICKESGMKERKVQYALRELEAAGLIRPVGSTKGGRSKSVKYRLSPSITGKDAHDAPFNPEKGCMGAGERVHGTAIKGALRAPEPLNNHMNQSADAPALEARAPRRCRPPEPGESPKEKEERQLFDLAATCGWNRRDGESDRDYLSRIRELNKVRVASVA